MPLLKGIVKLSLFRCSPLSLKMHFWLTTDDLNNRTEYKTDIPVEPLRYNVEFYNELQRRGLTLTDEKVYSWTHLWGGHVPYQTNEFMQEVESSDSLTQARGYLFAVSQYIEEMKKIGAYDNSLIIVTTDHGDENNPFVTLMIKYPNEEFDTMQINSAPVMHADIMPTISYYAFGECIGSGRNIRDIGIDEQRERYYRCMCYDPDYKHADRSESVGQWDLTANGENRYNVFYEYTFTGNQDTLYEMMGNGEYEVRVLPDSFY